MTLPCQPPAEIGAEGADRSTLPTLFPRIVNRLEFRTNSHTIVPFLLCKESLVHHRPGFSLNALAELPKELWVPELPVVIDLSLKNTALPILDDAVRLGVIACLSPHYHGKSSPSELHEAVERTGSKLGKDSATREESAVLSRIIENHGSYGYFSHIDWGLDHWGCFADILSVSAETFKVPTPGITFTTLATPPILALQRLANTFPSVRFTLHYAVEKSEAWSEVEFHPFPPFGY